MYNFKRSFRLVLIIVSVLYISLSFTLNVFAQDKIVVEAAGQFSFSCPMMGSIVPSITDICKKYGDKVELKVYDTATAEGKAFLSKKGLAENIMTVIYIDGKDTYTVDGKKVVFRDMYWQPDDLDKVISQKLQGIDTSSGNSAGSTNYTLMIIILAGIVIIALIVLYLLKSKKKQRGEHNVG